MFFLFNLTLNQLKRILPWVDGEMGLHGVMCTGFSTTISSGSGFGC